ncbi:MAG: glutamyl-tRNA amidotransferase, partial [Rhodospirillaceae bacterium]|nr:glutamyl-tRNA amidotransferase [Rhodospirillaceae bacterium]
FPAPLKGLPLDELNTVRDQIMCLCAYGGLTGVATVTIPGATVDGLPVGLSIIGACGSDAALVGLARVLTQQKEGD